MDTTIQQLTVPFSRLIRDDVTNVRKSHDKDSIESLKASILAYGLIQPIVVRPPVAGDADLEGQLYRVFAGGRRHRAIGALIEEKKLPADTPVPIVVREADDASAEAISLSENIIRREMQPVDEFRAFKELADKGASVEDLALRFGQTERFVRGRLALGNLHPEILSALERDEISISAAMAYTLNPDPERQVAFWRSTANWNRGDAHTIKHNMRGAGAVRADSTIARVIGEEAYRAAGGEVLEDLFGQETSWISGEVVERLRVRAIEELKATKLAEGWSFAMTPEEAGLDSVYSVRILAPQGTALTEEEAARMDEIAALLESEVEDDDEREALEAEHEALDDRSARYSAEQKAKAGVLIDPHRLEVREGAILSEDQASGAAASAAGAAKEKDPLALTQSLKDKIGATATDALREAIAAKPDLALAFLAAVLESAEAMTAGTGRPSRIKVERLDYTTRSGEARGLRSAFAAYVELPAAELRAAVAKQIAASADLSETWFQKDYASDDVRADVRAHYLQAFGAKPLAHFDAASYFASCTKAQITAAMKEMVGREPADGKKSDMADEAAAEARARGWLPEQLRLKGYKLKKA